MSEPDQPAPLPDKSGNDKKPHPKIIWLLIAFLPSLLALILMPFPKIWPVTLTLLFILNLFCSASASAELVRDMRDKEAKGGLMFFLVFFFFLANIGISFFIGCAVTLRL